MPHTTLIIHRYADHPIAGVLFRHLRCWTMGAGETFLLCDVFDAVKASHNLEESAIRDFVATKLVVIPITTPVELDWLYLLKFLVAPGSGSPRVRPVVFWCSEPTSRDEPFLVKAYSQSDVYRFVSQAHKEDGFWPGERPLNKGIDGDELTKRSNDLFQDLREAISWPTYVWKEEHFSLILSKHEASDLVNLDALDDAVENEREAFEILMNKCEIVAACESVLRNFGLAQLKPGLKLVEMIGHWRNSRQRASTSEEWINALLGQLWHGCASRPFEAPMDLMYSMDIGSEWRAWVLVHEVRRYSDGSIQFDVYIHRGQIHSMQTSTL